MKEYEWPFARLPNVAISSENLPGLCGAKRCQSQWHGIDGFRPMCHTSSISTLPRILKYKYKYRYKHKYNCKKELMTSVQCVTPVPSQCCPEYLNTHTNTNTNTNTTHKWKYFWHNFKQKICLPRYYCRKNYNLGDPRIRFVFSPPVSLVVFLFHQSHFSSIKISVDNQCGPHTAASLRLPELRLTSMLTCDRCPQILKSNLFRISRLNFWIFRLDLLRFPVDSVAKVVIISP